eukprot:scpid17263/ scgid5749/ 
MNMFACSQPADRGFMKTLSAFLFALVGHVFAAELIVEPSYSAHDISLNISSAPPSETLQVLLVTGVYDFSRTVAILATRTAQISISSTGSGPVTLECSTTDFIRIVGVANDYSLGDAADANPIMIKSCPLLFSTPTGSLSLTNVHVSAGSYALDGGVTAAIAIFSESVLVVDISITSCVFSGNAVTPLLVDVPGSCVRINSCRFEYNNIVVQDSSMLALNKSILPLVITAGVSIGMHGHLADNNACSGGSMEQYAVTNTSFMNNTILMDITNNTAVSDPGLGRRLIDRLNGGQQMCGGSIYAYMSGEAGNSSIAALGQDTIAGALTIGEGTLFQNGRVNDLSPVVASGGAVCLHFRSDSSQWKVSMDDVNFTHNHAERSGALHVLFDDTTHSNVLASRNATFYRNRAYPHDKHTYHQSRGGAVSVDLGRNTISNDANFTYARFDSNVASEGGGMHVNYHSAEEKNKVLLDGCVFNENSGISGSGLYAVSSHQQGMKTIRDGAAILIEIHWSSTLVKDCVFTSNKAYTSGALGVSFGHVVLLGSITFYDNLNSAVNLVNSYMYVTNNTEVMFDKNVGGLGGGMFLSDSQVIVYENVQIWFNGNIAQTTGGGIHATMHTRSVGLVASELTPHCFITYHHVGISVSNWTCSISFRENMAGQAGAGIFAPDFTPCLFLASYDEQQDIDYRSSITFKQRWEEHFFDNGTGGNVVNDELTLGSPYAGPLGGSSNGIPSVDHAWSPRWLPTISYEKLQGDPDFRNRSIPNSLSTDVVAVTWNTTESCPDPAEILPDGLVVIRCVVASDEYFRLRGVATDQFGQPRDALFMVIPAVDDDDLTNNTQIRTSPYLQFRDNWTSDLAIAGWIGSSANFSLSVVGTARLVVHTLHVTFAKCRHGFYSIYTNKHVVPYLHLCACGNTKRHLDVQLCEKNRFAYLFNGLWGGDNRPDDCNNNVTAQKCRGYAQSKFEVTICPVGYCKTSKSDPNCSTSLDGVGCLYNYTDQNEICANNRTGILCAKCPPGHTRSITVESGKCTECTDNDLYRIIPFVLVVPIIVFFILFLNVPLSNDLRGLFFAAAVTRSLICPEDEALLSHGWFSSIMTMGEVAWPGSSCIISGLSSLQAIALGYAAPIGAIFVMGLLHLLTKYCKPLHNWVGRTDQNTLKHGTWLVIFFTFQKVAQTSIKFFICVPLFGEWRFFYEADQKCFSSMPHVSYFVVALLCIFILVVVMVVCFCFAKGWNILCIKADLFVGSILRRGLEDRYCWWAVWDLLRRMMIFFGTMLVVKGCEARQIYMLCVTLLIFAVHLAAKPYVTPREYDDRFRLVTWSTPFFLRSGESCNRLEGVVLFNMVVMTGFSLLYRHLVSGTKWILIGLAVWPLIIFALLVLYKLMALLVLRFNFLKCRVLLCIFKPKSDHEEHTLVNSVHGDLELDGAASPPRKALRDGMLAMPLLDGSSHSHYSTMPDLDEH